MSKTRLSTVLALWVLQIVAPTAHVWAAHGHADEAHLEVARDGCSECAAKPAGPILERHCPGGPCDDPDHHHHGHADLHDHDLCWVCKTAGTRALAPVPVDQVRLVHVTPPAPSDDIELVRSRPLLALRARAPPRS